MRKWFGLGLIICLLAVLVLLFSREMEEVDPYKGMSFIPEQYEGFPLFKGVQAAEHEYVIKGNHVEALYALYLTKLSQLGWELRYKGSALDDDDPENDWGGFRFRWKKEGFDGELWIVASYNQFEAQTEVRFDHVK